MDRRKIVLTVCAHAFARAKAVGPLWPQRLRTSFWPGTAAGTLFHTGLVPVQPRPRCSLDPVAETS